MLYKNALTKIKKSLGRYISLMIIIMVGVGFYAGVDISAPDIIHAADRYFKDYRLMDFKIIGSMGLTDNDAAALMQIDGVSAVIPSYSLDVQSKGNAIRLHSIDDVNKVRLIDGKMAASDTQCLADSRKYALGDIVEITDDTENKLKNESFTVVGLIESVLYLHDDYGSTTTGNGKLTSFAFIPKDNFILDAYTEIYIIAETNGAESYSSEYESYSKRLSEELVKIKPDRERARYEEIYIEAMDIIAGNEAELNEERAKFEAELSDAKKELDDNSRELDEGKETGLLEFSGAKAELDRNAAQLSGAKAEIARSEAALTDTVREKTAEFDLARQQIADGWEEINTALSAAGISGSNIDPSIDELEQAVKRMSAQLGILPPDHPEYEALSGAIAEYSKNLEELKQLRASMDTLSVQEGRLDDGTAVFNAEIDKARDEIQHAKNIIAESENRLNGGYEKYNENLASFYVEISDNEKKIEDGYAEYFENLEKFNAEMADAEQKINDAKAELSDIEYPKWYISDRSAAVGYDVLDSSIEVVATVAAVLPLFFIVISTLMTSNSMARMIVEERGELGTLLSLGYKDRSIIFTYVLYVLSAVWLGAATGFLIGCRFIPPLVYSNFTVRLPPLELVYNTESLAVILAVASVLMALVTLFACGRELRQKPAYLMRPIPPKRGQRIFLERVGPIWRRLSFTWKVTLRNMLRYKKRALMTVIGVSGCTALLITAFGLRDGMGGVAQKQYGDILRYDNMIILKDETAAIEGELQELLEREHGIRPLLIKHNAYRCEKGNVPLDCYVVVPHSSELFEQYYHLKSTLDKREINLDDNGIVITQQIAKIYKLKKGDELTVLDADNNSFVLTVSDVAENYTSNYIYMNPSVYKQVFGEAAEYNAVVSHHSANESELAGRLIDSELVVSVIFTSDAMQTVYDNTQRLNGVIFLIIVVASLLAVVVLYNLTAINISERIREIATLKVLGFRETETNAYIYREAIILTLLSIAAGIPLGIALHRYVIGVIEDSVLSLTLNIEWFSFALSAVLTMTFSGFMQVVTYFKLRKVDMIESLKSVE